MAVMAILAVASTVLSLYGASQQAAAMRQQAKNQQMMAAANQQQLNYQAGQEEAAGQRQAIAERRKAQLIASRAMAVAAASGAGTTGIEGLLTGITKAGEESAQGALYESTERAKGLRYRGQIGGAEASNQAAVTKREASATMLGAYASAASSLAGRYAPSAAPTSSYQTTAAPVVERGIY